MVERSPGAGWVQAFRVGARDANASGLEQKGSRAAALDEAALHGSLSAAWNRGRAAWPTLDLDGARFAAHLGRHVGAHAGPAAPARIEALHVEDLYLACACLHGLPGALRAFERSHLERIPAMVGHLRLAGALVEEVRQTTFQRLFVSPPGQEPRIAAYAGRAALGVWLRATVIRVALNLLESERRHPTSAGDEALLDRLRFDASPAPDPPELQFIKRRDREAVRAAFAAALEGLSSDGRNLLRLHYVEGLSLSEIAVLFGVHKATVSRRLAQAEADLAQSLRGLLGDRLRLPEAEVQSLVDLVLSQLDLSLSRLLPRP